MTVAQRGGRGRGGSQDLLRCASPASKRAAERINAVSALQRAARRCVKHLGRSCAAALLELVRAELAGASGPVAGVRRG
jgi:hypothetical protein